MAEQRRRILITGAAGFLGEATLDYITSNDPSAFVVCVDTRQTLGPSGETRRFVSVVRDVTETLDDLLEDYSINTVVHLAFLLQPQRHPDEARRVNVDATRQLLDSCAKAGVTQFVYLSSATVYGAHAKNDRPFTEENPPNPVKGFTYSEHKVEAEKLVQAFKAANTDCAVSILRGCVVMGPGARNFITESLGLRMLPVPTGADPEMQFLHVDDYGSAVQAALDKRAEGIFNIAGTGTVHWRDMIKVSGAKPVPAPAFALKAITDLAWKLGLQQRSSSAGISFIQYPWTVSIAKISNELGWRPKHSSIAALESWVHPK